MKLPDAEHKPHSAPLHEAGYLSELRTWFI